MIVLHTPIYTPTDSFKVELSQAQDFQLNALDNRFTQESGDIEKKMTELAAFSHFTPEQRAEWDRLQSEMARVLSQWKAVSKEKSKRGLKREYSYQGGQ